MGWRPFCTSRNLLKGNRACRRLSLPPSSTERVIEECVYEVRSHEVAESRRHCRFVSVYALVLFLGLATCWQVVGESHIMCESLTGNQTENVKYGETWNISLYPAPVSICWRRCVHGQHRNAGRSRAPIDGKRRAKQTTT